MRGSGSSSRGAVRRVGGLVREPGSCIERIKYGIQDDAWLEFGPGKLNERLETLKRLGVPLVRFTVHWNVVAPKRPADPDLAARPRVRLASL